VYDFPGVATAAFAARVKSTADFVSAVIEIARSETAAKWSNVTRRQQTD